MHSSMSSNPEHAIDTFDRLSRNGDVADPRDTGRTDMECMEQRSGHD